MSFYTIVLMSACVTYIASIRQVTLEVINYRHSSFAIGGFALIFSHSVLWVLNTVPLRNSYTYHLSHRTTN